MKGKIIVVESDTTELPVGQRVLVDSRGQGGYNVYPITERGTSRNFDIITFTSGKMDIWACGAQRMRITGRLMGEKKPKSVTLEVQ